MALLLSVESLSGSRIATTVASLQEGGNTPDSQMELKTVSSMDKEHSGRLSNNL